MRDHTRLRAFELEFPMKWYVFLWERHLAAMIATGSHSHKGGTSLPIGWRRVS
jgi:hypothetical protein